MKNTPPLVIILLILILCICAFLGYSLFNTKTSAVQERQELTETITRAQADLRAATERIGALETVLTETQSLLQGVVDENADLSESLEEERDQNEDFERQIRKIGTTVGDLDKLSKTDKELLQKYSKVFFLNEHYIPLKLQQIDDVYLSDKNDPTFIHAKVVPFLEDMLDDAREDGVDMQILSAYRSFDEQRELKGNYTVTYGSGANTFSADQGYSEHQLGTAIDVTTGSLAGGLTSFEQTAAYTWLLNNAYRYGFVLSYPKDNAFYIFEPWHWRFVGTMLARELYQSETSFYDLDQRTIDEYLISVFD